MHNGQVAEESRQQGGGHWVVLSWNHQTLGAGLHPCSVPGIFVPWWEQSRLPRGEKQELTSWGLFQQPFFCKLLPRGVRACCVCSGSRAGQAGTAAVRITQHRTLPFAPAVLQIVLKGTKLYSCLKLFFYNSKMKNIVSELSNTILRKSLILSCLRTTVTFLFFWKFS